MFATDQVENELGSVVFLHVDLRSDGLIDAAGCYWYRVLRRNAGWRGSDTTTGDPRNSRPQISSAPVMPGAQANGGVWRR